MDVKYFIQIFTDCVRVVRTPGVVIPCLSSCAIKPNKSGIHGRLEAILEVFNECGITCDADGSLGENAFADIVTISACKASTIIRTQCLVDGEIVPMANFEATSVNFDALSSYCDWVMADYLVSEPMPKVEHPRIVTIAPGDELRKDSEWTGIVMERGFLESIAQVQGDTNG